MSDLSFAKIILPLAESLFPSEEIQVEIFRGPGMDIGEFLPEVRLVHVPSSEVVTCNDHASQIENKVEALLRLRARLDGLG